MVRVPAGLVLERIRISSLRLYFHSNFTGRLLMLRVNRSLSPDKFQEPLKVSGVVDPEELLISFRFPSGINKISSIVFPDLI